MTNEDLESVSTVATFDRNSLEDPLQVKKPSIIKKIPCRFHFIINHEGKFKIAWDWLVLVLVIFTAIQVPYFSAFKTESPIIFEMNEKTEIAIFVVLAAVVDCIFIFDIFLNFRTTYIRSSSETTERRSKKLAKHYLKTWFMIDLLAAIPFDWIMHNQEPSGGHSSTLIGLLKCGRLLRLFRVARKLDQYSEYGVAVLFLLMCFFTLFSHWLACLWNFIARMEENVSHSWVHRLNRELYPQAGNSSNGLPIIKLTVGERYIASLYFVVSSLTSVGFGNISATTVHEQIFSVIIMIIGALMYACIFGNMVAIVQRLYTRATHYHIQLNNMREYLKYNKIPQELQNNINGYVKREWQVSSRIDCKTPLNNFPECLQADVTYHLYEDVFYNVPVFRDATVSCMRALSMKFKTMTLQANIFVLRRGDEIKTLYIVGKGEVEALSQNGESHGVEKQQMELGGYKFCRNATFGYDFNKFPDKPKANSNVRTTELTDIHYIKKEDMLEVMHTYPKFAVSFQQLCQHGFDLNDTDEEGYFSTPTRKRKTTIGLVARQALARPFINSFNRISQKIRSKSTYSFNGDINYHSENFLLDPKFTKQRNGNRHHLTMSNVELSVDPQTPVKANKRKVCQTFSDTAYLDNHRVNYLPLTPKLNKQSKEIEFNVRLRKLEEKVQHMADNTEEKLDQVMNILLEMKKSSKKKQSLESVESTPTHQIDFTIGESAVDEQELADTAL